MKCAPMGKSSVSPFSSLSTATGSTRRFSNAFLAVSSSKETRTLLSPDMTRENFSPPVTISRVTLRSSKNRGFHLLAPPRPRGSSTTQATVFAGSRPCSTISSSSSSILLFSCFFLLQDLSAGSSMRTLVEPVMNWGVKAMTSKDLSFQMSLQKRSSTLGNCASASSALENHLSPACRSATRASICFSTAQPCGTYLRIRVDVSSTAVAR
mmetsp:Transcript_44894/g.129884  ORF Transcript_44894/g.129884 Transcript_44894/m.129884 type:complete len:210 (-) Transcript_44894:2289-2918(-)